jgi:hypothetical protein
VDIAVGIINWNSGHLLERLHRVASVHDGCCYRSLEEAAGFADNARFIRNESISDLLAA